MWAWLRVSDDAPERERSQTRVDVAVPSGNFGNIYAGHLARSMGVPIRRLILATNENNVLDEFFRTGVYAPRPSEATLVTSSPSMDISKASNLERFIYTLLGPDIFVEAWSELERTGRLDLSAQRDRMAEEFGFVSGTSTHADRLAAIRLVHAATGRLIDPHTADGVTVALTQREEGVPILVTEAAKAAKFGETVAEAIGSAPPLDASLARMLRAEQRVVEIPNDIERLRALIAADAVRR